MFSKAFLEFLERQVPRNAGWLLILLIAAAWLLKEGVSFWPVAGLVILFFNLDRLRSAWDAWEERRKARNDLDAIQAQNKQATKSIRRRINPDQSELELEPPVKVDKAKVSDQGKAL